MHVQKKPELIHSTEDYQDACAWQITLGKELKRKKQTDRYGISVKKIPGVRPSTYGVYLEAY